MYSNVAVLSFIYFILYIVIIMSVKFCLFSFISLFIQTVRSAKITIASVDTLNPHPPKEKMCKGLDSEKILQRQWIW